MRPPQKMMAYLFSCCLEESITNSRQDRRRKIRPGQAFDVIQKKGERIRRINE